MKFLLQTLFISFSFASALLGQHSWPEQLITTPEESEFVKTSSYADVMHFLAFLDTKSPDMSLISIGESLEEKKIPVAILSRPAVRTAAEAKASGKPVIYIQGNIHAGEVEGKEAILMLMREILLGEKFFLLDNQIILFAPIYNTDSNDKMEKGRRASQEDSPLEVGLRENSQGLDLNRDGVKIEAPETQGLFSNIVSIWDPQMFVDLHTTNGTWHAYSLTWAPSYHTCGQLAPYAYTRELLLDITATLKERDGLLLGPYGEYRLEEGWPLKNFYTYNHHPRYLVNQFGLRNRMAILSEAFSHERFYQRINSTYKFVLEILSYTNSHAKEIQTINKAAEDATIREVVDNAGKVKKGVRFEMVPSDTLNNFLTYDFISSENSDGTSTLLRTGKITSYDSIKYHAKFQPVLASMLPRGYIIPATFSNTITVLKKLGIRIDSLSSSKMYTGESFMVDKLTKAERKFEGHNLAKVEGHFVKHNQKFKAGDYIVDLAQPLGNLIFYMLEPQSDDGLVAWNFFDSYFEKHGVNNKAVRYPVFKYTH